MPWLNRRMVGVLVAVLTVGVLGGCPVAPTDDAPFLDGDGNLRPATATAVTFDSSGRARFRGSISTADDIDVFAVGVLQPGDRLYVDVQSKSGGLDPVAAVFDSREYLLAFNDDRTPDGSNLNPLIDIVIPERSDAYFVGIIGYPGDGAIGTYEATIRVTRDVGFGGARAQVVYLDYRGGTNITVPNVGRFNLAPFSATDVGLPAAQTASLKARVTQIVRERYVGYDFTVISSDEGGPPSEPHSTVYFGGNDPQAFAISEQIDTFNADLSDDAIVYTQSFQGAFGVSPSFEQMAQALGNTVAHEIGHLLGLVHTTDCDDLMDSSCFNSRLLAPQAFKSAARLSTSVFPFGFQSATEILTWLLGLD